MDDERMDDLQGMIEEAMENMKDELLDEMDVVVPVDRIAEFLVYTHDDFAPGLFSDCVFHRPGEDRLFHRVSNRFREITYSQIC